jgi:hypothetical protein
MSVIRTLMRRDGTAFVRADKLREICVQESKVQSSVDDANRAVTFRKAFYVNGYYASKDRFVFAVFNDKAEAMEYAAALNAEWKGGPYDEGPERSGAA